MVFCPLDRVHCPVRWFWIRNFVCFRRKFAEIISVLCRLAYSSFTLKYFWRIRRRLCPSKSTQKSPQSPCTLSDFSHIFRICPNVHTLYGFVCSTVHMVPYCLLYICVGVSLYTVLYNIDGALVLEVYILDSGMWRKKKIHFPWKKLLIVYR